VAFIISHEKPECQERSNYTHLRLHAMNFTSLHRRKKVQIGGRDIGAAQSDTSFTTAVKPFIGLNLTNIALSLHQPCM
jgi:hypothetical protein